MLIYLVGVGSVAYIIYGGYKYIMSQGNPESLKNAQNTIMNAIIGLVIAIISVNIVQFIIGRLGTPATSVASEGTISGIILPIVFGAAAAVSVLYIVIGGLRYIAASGDPGSIKQAKDTIMYSIIGLVATLSAFAIVNFILERVGGVDSADPLVGPNGIITITIRTLAYVAGAISTIMIIVGGIRYITSGGDPGSTKGAKDTVMYALIGLAFAVTAQVIVLFVLSKL
jgi:hypothetical protein